MIYRWIGSVTGAAILTFATFLAMPALLRVDSPEAGEEAVRQYAIHNVTDQREPFIITPRYDHRYDLDYETFSGTVSVLESFAEGIVLPSNCEAEVEFEHSGWRPFLYASWINISTENHELKELEIDHPFESCHRLSGWGCRHISHTRAIESVSQCLTLSSNLPDGTYRFTLLYSVDSAI